MNSLRIPFISLVTPVYNEDEGIDYFFDSVLPILNEITDNFEILCIDDGSKDSSFDKLEVYAKKDNRIKIIKLSRNFGKEAAVSAGLNQALGECVILMDFDLQDPVYLITKMVKIWSDSKNSSEPINIVSAIRSKRVGDTIIKKITSFIFYKLINIITPGLDENVSDCRLLDQQVVNCIKQLKEKSRFMRFILKYPGFKSHNIYYERPKRKFGKTSFTFISLIKYAVDGAFSESYSLLSKVSFITFVLLLTITIVSSLYVFIRHILGYDISNYSVLILTILGCTSAILLSLTIVTSYIIRIYLEVKNRPLYFIDKFIKNDDGFAKKD